MRLCVLCRFVICNAAVGIDEDENVFCFLNCASVALLCFALAVLVRVTRCQAIQIDFDQSLECALLSLLNFSSLLMDKTKITRK